MINKIVGYWESREVFIDGQELIPTKSQKLRNHSPDGFAWGYGGSGPAQLALAILEFTDVETAASLYQDFKWEVIALLPQTDFVFEIDIKGWIVEKMKAKEGKDND